MSNRVAVIGVGMTKFMRRAQEAPGELAAQAVRMATGQPVIVRINKLAYIL